MKIRYKLKNPFTIGQKVVPISKSVGDKESIAWNLAKKKGQPFLYIVGKNHKGTIDLLLSTVPDGSGDFFMLNDVIPYED